MTLTPFYTDDAVTLYHGDCLDVLRQLDDNSVDAVVTDPPYGLEFMGKAWDRLGDIGQASHGGFTDAAENFKGMALPKSYNASANVKCQRCAKWKFDHVGRKCECGAAAEWPNVKAQQGRAMQDWHYAWAAECLRVLKPGGHMLAFGGSRTWHRLASAIEDAGFEIRDSLAWLYSQGFPKSLDVSKAIDKAAGAERASLGVAKGAASSRTESLGVFAPEYEATSPATPNAEQWQGWGTALKPAFEPIVVARKPLAGTVAANVLAWGTGALNIDGCRVGGEERVNPPSGAPGANNYRLQGGDGRDVANARRYAEASKSLPPTTVAGRWPANVILDQSQADQLDKQSGETTSIQRTGARTGKTAGTYGQFAGQADVTMGHGDTGGASRFFYVAKADTGQRPKVDGTGHPTVKPLDLMRWLVRLVTPPGGTVLDPFAGSGTTAEACVIEHFRCITIERDDTYLPLIVARLTKPIQIGLNFEEPA